MNKFMKIPRRTPHSIYIHMLDSESSAALSFVLLLHPLPENSSENSSFFRSSRHCCAKQSGTNVDLPLPVAASTITTPKDSARIGVLFLSFFGNPKQTRFQDILLLLMVQKSRIHSPVEGTVVCLPLGQVLYIRTVVGNGNSEASTVGMIIILPE